MRHGAVSRVTIADVAKAAGVTKGTVSRALSGRPDISPATRRRIERLAEDLGYRPLGSAQAIRTGRCRAIGLVIETSEHDAHRPFLAEFLAGLSEGAAAEHWTLTVAAALTPEDTLATCTRLIAEHKADGFVIQRTRLHDPRVEMLKQSGVPFVLYGRVAEDAGCAYYDIDGHAAIAGAVARLAALGHRRIAYVGGAGDHTYAHLRAEGFASGMAAAGLPVDPALIAETALTRHAGEQAAARLLDCADPPTAFVFAVDSAALGLWTAAERRGLEVGRDLAVIGYDGIVEGAQADPPLATCAVDVRRAGLRLADLLIRRCRGEPPEALRIIEQAEFLDRGTAVPPPSHAETQRTEREDTTCRN